MLANCFAIGVVLAVGATARAGAPAPAAAGAGAGRGARRARRRDHLARAAWVQVVEADAFATASSLSEQGDGGYRFEYNPRLVAAARADRARHDLRPPRRWCSRRAGRQEIAADRRAPTGKAGARSRADVRAGRTACYPLGGLCSACWATGTARRTGARATRRSWSATATRGSRASTIGSGWSRSCIPRTGAHDTDHQARLLARCCRSCGTVPPRRARRWRSLLGPSARRAL